MSRISLPGESIQLPLIVADALFQCDMSVLLQCLPDVSSQDQLDLLAFCIANMGIGYAGSEASFQLDAMRLVLDAGANPNHQRVKRSLLGIACAKTHPALVDILLARGACVNDGKIPTQSPPLAGAIDFDNHTTLNKLLRLGADPNVLDEQGRPAWFRAVAGNRQKFLPRLREMGADMRAVDSKGQTILHAWVDEQCGRMPPSMTKRNEQTLWRLVKWGADLSMLDLEGRTAQDHAHQLRQANAARLLGIAQAQVDADQLTSACPSASSVHSSRRL